MITLAMKKQIIMGTAVALVISALTGVGPVSGSPDSSVTPPSAKPPGDEINGKESFPARYLTARNLYLQGVDGDEDAAEKARKILEELVQQEPDNPLVVAYLGSCRVLESKEAVLPWKKGELAREGLKLLDRAVNMAPENLEVRFVRGVSSYPLPFFFGVGDQAKEDFAFVAARLADDPTATRPEIAAGAFYYHGICLEDDGRESEAVRFWKKAAAAAPGSSFAEKAGEKLEEME